ncbi:FkbM family methyltransferase [Maritimibacter sp. DP07]|uniref:FkbM family methyltransferase n=1 Tax=Maritimibacter harenae TaxID=2606218 RepID=A0A845M5U4_9RHOB|nr:FkbM family methyltransferase [Maritimibacter harenae]MZR11521.1 FkbM family methyltransferase [Maritimibacter harenae]
MKDFHVALTERIFERLGLGPVQTAPPLEKPPSFMKIAEYLGINLVFDIGANRGQFAKKLIENDFAGRIVSFEPTLKAHAQLVEAARPFDNWTVHPRTAIGDEHSKLQINVAGNNGQSSSFLDMGELHAQSAPRSRYIDIEEVDVTTIDAIFDEYVKSTSKTLLKIDVQGYEEQVLKGALRALKQIMAVKLECSLVSLYENDKTYEFYIEFLESLGFGLWDLEPGFREPETGRLLQFDAFFVRP